MMKKLNNRQRAFVDEYIIDMNATQAAIRAGYSEKTARSQGQRLLTHVDISKAISERMKQKTEELIMKQDEILVLLSEQARREAIDHQVVSVEKASYDEHGNYLGIEKTAEIVETPTQNKDAIRALELLGKRYGMWTDKQEIEHSGAVMFVDDIE